MRANKSAQSRGVCKCDQIVEVRTLRVGECVLIGLYSPQSIKGWGDLDGMVPQGHGSWQDSRYLLNFFELIQQDKVVAKDFNFKKRNLKGMRCKVVHYNRSQGHSFVEFDENVGGGSADGLGKAGFCVVLPSELLENVNEPLKDDLKEKKTPERTVDIEEAVAHAKELWATISDQEPIAIKAKIATKKSNAAKQAEFIKSRLADVEWEKSAEKLWNEGDNGEKIQWKDRVSSYSIHDLDFIDP